MTVPQKRPHSTEGESVTPDNFDGGVPNLPPRAKNDHVSFHVDCNAYTVTNELRQEPIALSCNRAYPKKPKVEELDRLPPSQQVRLHSEPPYHTSPTGNWLLELPNTFEPLAVDQNFDNMNQPQMQSSRSSSSWSISESISELGKLTSRDKRYVIYGDYNFYCETMELKGAFMRPSQAGMTDDDKKLCKQLLTTSQPIPQDTPFDNDHCHAFLENLLGRSEQRIITDLHPLVMPSVENLAICGREEFANLIEGHYERWYKSGPFHGPTPQPDHTYGFKGSSFDEQQRRKLNFDSTERSHYAARQDIWLPFLVGDVELAGPERNRFHSMIVALRGVVDLYRRANRVGEVHRRVLGFSVSHNDHGAQVFAHYPEIDGDRTTFWQEPLTWFSFFNNKCKERWACYQFTLNVCQLFALPFLERLKSTIDALPDTAEHYASLPDTTEHGASLPDTTESGASIQDLQIDFSELESLDEGCFRNHSSICDCVPDLEDTSTWLDELQKEPVEEQEQSIDQPTGIYDQYVREQKARLEQSLGEQGQSTYQPISAHDHFAQQQALYTARMRQLDAEEAMYRARLDEIERYKRF